MAERQTSFASKPLKVVSLFDGISCGHLALEKAGYAISNYEAFEIDKYARSISKYNYPHIAHHGDVLGADFRKFSGYDLVMGRYSLDISSMKM